MFLHLLSSCRCATDPANPAESICIWGNTTSRCCFHAAYSYCSTVRIGHNVLCQPFDHCFTNCHLALITLLSPVSSPQDANAKALTVVMGALLLRARSTCMSTPTYIKSVVLLQGGAGIGFIGHLCTISSEVQQHDNKWWTIYVKNDVAINKICNKISAEATYMQCKVPMEKPDV